MNAFILFFALSQFLIIFSPKLDVYSCLGKTRYCSRHGFLLLNVNPPPVKKKSSPKVQQGMELAASGVVPTCKPLTAFQWAVFEFVDFHHFSVCKCFFFLNPRDFICADTYQRSNLHESILLRQAFCALLNDGCLREMVIMIDFEP